MKQIMIPERPNLRYFLITGPSSPSNVLQLPFVTDFLLGDDPGLVMIYVQTIDDGTSIFFDIYEFSVSNSLIEFPTNKTTPEKKFAFLHSNLSEEAKRKIISDAQSLKIRVLISTSSAGAGVHLPITTFIGWGLDREPSGIVQASGRTARGSGEGDVVWIHHPKLHGRRISSKSQVRELLKERCIRACQNSWFSEGVTCTTDSVLEPHSCCSFCMKECLKANSCTSCAKSLDKFKFLSCEISSNKSIVGLFSNFLKSLDISERCPPEAPVYENDSLAKMILCELDETKDLSETVAFLEIFSLGDEICQEIRDFLRNELGVLFSESLPVNTNDTMESSENESLVSQNDSDNSEEYFDEETE